MTQADRNDKAKRQRELAIVRYVQAIDGCDLDTISEVLALAVDDPELDRQIQSVNEALHAEAGLPTLEEQAQRVRQMILRHLPSAVPQVREHSPLTVQDVAAKLEAEHAADRAMLSGDLAANRELLRNVHPLPISITASSIAALASKIGVTASKRYWEFFRRAAVTLTISRQRGQVQLAAARRSEGGRSRRTNAQRKSEEDEQQ